MKIIIILTVLFLLFGCNDGALYQIEYTTNTGITYTDTATKILPEQRYKNKVTTRIHSNRYNDRIEVVYYPDNENDHHATLTYYDNHNQKVILPNHSIVSVKITPITKEK